MLLGGAHARMQPVYVGDVVAAMTAALDDTHACGKTYELGGPQVYRWARSCACAPPEHRAQVWPMPMGRQALFFECLPGEC